MYLLKSRMNDRHARKEEERKMKINISFRVTRHKSIKKPFRGWSGSHERSTHFTYLVKDNNSFQFDLIEGVEKTW